MKEIVYKDPTPESNQLTSDHRVFVDKLKEYTYPEFKQSLIFSVFRAIDGSLAGEGGKIRRETKGLGGDIEEETRSTMLKAVLKKVEKLKDPANPVPEGLDEISRYYKHLLNLFGRNGTEAGVAAFSKNYNFEESDYLGKEKKINEMAFEIFDMIKDATERYLEGELTIEEEELLKSKDPEKRHRKKELQARIKKRDQADLENASHALNVAQGPEAYSFTAIDEVMKTSKDATSNKKVTFSDDVKKEPSWTEYNPSKIESGSNVDRLAKEIGNVLKEAGVSNRCG